MLPKYDNNNFQAHSNLTQIFKAYAQHWITETIATSLYSGPIYYRNTYQTTKPDSHSEQSLVEIGIVYGNNSKKNHRNSMSYIEERQPHEKFNLRRHWAI